VTTAREVLIGTARVRREHLHLRSALLTGVLCTLITAACIARDVESWALPMVIGCAFTGILNLTAAPDVRVKAMAWTVPWLVSATLLGGLVSNWRWFDIAVVGLVGLAGGYAGALGQRGILIGVLSMVAYTVFAGVGVPAGTALQTAVLLGAGSVLHLVISSVAMLVRSPSVVRTRTERPEPWVHRLNPRLRRDNLFLHHAVRLSLALIVGTAVADVVAWPHPYWIPMTIVWMTKPDAEGTVTRVVERVIGTIVGVGVAALLIDGVSDGDIAIALYAGLGVFLLLGFIYANYPIAVTGVTLMVITLLSFPGRSVVDTLDYRIIATVVAGVITLVAALSLWRRTPEVTA
jgi:hypothetical protein